MTDRDETHSLRFWALALALLVLHAALLLWLVDRGMGEFLDLEEEFVAFVASELAAGTSQPWTAHIYTPYETGTLLVGLATVPVFALLGQTVWALKLVSLLISCGTLLLLMLLGRRIFGERCALLAGLLLAVGPPGWLIRSVQTLGDSSEVLLLVCGQWLLVLWLERRRRAGLTTSAPALLLGLVTGLCLTFSLTAVPSVLAMLVYWALVPAARPTRRQLGALAAGLLLGQALPLWNLLRHDVPVYTVRRHLPYQMLMLSESWWSAAQGIFGQDGTAAYSMTLDGAWLGELPLLLLSRAYFGVGLLCWFAMAWRGRSILGPQRTAHEGLIPVLLYGAYLAAYLATPLRQPYLLLLLVPVSALLMARCMVALAGRTGASRKLQAAGLSLTVMLALLPFGGLVARSGRPLADAPACARPGRWRHRLPTFDLVRALREPADQCQLFGMGQMLPETSASQRVLVERSVARLPLAARTAFYRGVGYNWVWRGVSQARWVARCLALEQPLALAAAWGAGRCMGERLPNSELEALYLELATRVPPLLRAQFIEGLGYGLGYRFWHYPRLHRWALSVISAENWRPLGRGLRSRLDTLTDGPRHAQRLRVLSQMRLGIARLPSGRPVLTIQASQMQAGNLELAPADGGARLATDTGRHPARVEFRLTLARAGLFTIWARYATREPRPLTVTLDGVTSLHPTGRLTGGFGRAHLAWEKLGRLRLTAGSHTLVLRTEGHFPDLEQLRLYRD